MSLIRLYRAATGDRWTSEEVITRLWEADGALSRGEITDNEYEAIIHDLTPELDEADRRARAAEWRAVVRAYVGIRRSGRDIQVVPVPGDGPPVLHRGTGGKGRRIGLFGRPVWVRTTAWIEVGECWGRAHWSGAAAEA